MDKQAEFLENCLNLHERMSWGYIPTEFEVMKLMVDLDECGDLRNGVEMRQAANSYIYGRDFEVKMLWANLTVTIGYNLKYREHLYFIDKKHNETIVDFLIAEDFIENNKDNWGQDYVEPYKKTPLESITEIVNHYSHSFKREIADEYIVKMEALEEAKRLEEKRIASLDNDYTNIVDGPIRIKTIPICQKEEPIGWEPKFIEKDEDYIVVMDKEDDTIIGCGNVKRMTATIEGKGTVFLIKEVEFYYPGAYASFLNSLVNLPTKIKIIGEYSEVTKTFWNKMNADIDEEKETFELDRNKFQNTKYYKKVNLE